MQWTAAVGLGAGAYLLGSLPSGYWIGRWVAGVDLRCAGSRNIGAANAGRILGLRWGCLVLFLDMTKGALPVVLALHFCSALTEPNLVAIAGVGLAAFCGHLASPFLGFGGGKGVATSLGVCLMLVPKATLPAVAVFLLVAWRWRYVSLGSMTAASSLPFWTALAGYHPFYLALSSIFAVMIVIRHKSNIRALLAGEERKF